ncbi:YLP motif-containing protein 1 isoform X2 [Oreochromis niloticus]|uniref:YLP motif-containing protein 1 isoform X2 n=1 Tax=Oreochromis niloticus TaxID=8128 RepID=UPI000904FCDC|nr:YLP motif-containing protein 1 isoform X2 [Oreochromis niloticus]
MIHLCHGRRQEEQAVVWRRRREELQDQTERHLQRMEYLRRARQTGLTPTRGWCPPDICPAACELGRTTVPAAPHPPATPPTSGPASPAPLGSQGRPPELTTPRRLARAPGRRRSGLIPSPARGGVSRFGWMAPRPQSGDGGMWRGHLHLSLDIFRGIFFLICF